MLDVCACVIVEEEKERKARGNLCAEVRGIMVRRKIPVSYGHTVTRSAVQRWGSWGLCMCD